MMLTEFLLARIAEDEAAAIEARADEYLPTRDSPELEVRHHNGYRTVRVTSGRVLAECEAKRLVLDTCAQNCDCHADDILRSIALPYRTHPDYREDWAL